MSQPKSKHNAKVETVMSEFQKRAAEQSAYIQGMSDAEALIQKAAAASNTAALKQYGRHIVHTHLTKVAEEQLLVKAGRDIAERYVKDAVFYEFKKAMDADKSEGDATLDATQAPTTGKPDKDGQRTATRVKAEKVKKDGETALADQKTAQDKEEYLTGTLASLIETCKAAGVDFKAVLAQVQGGN